MEKLNNKKLLNSTKLFPILLVVIIMTTMCFTQDSYAVSPSTNFPVIFNEHTIENIVEKTGPAVVKIETTIEDQTQAYQNPLFSDSFFRDFFGREFNFTPTPQLRKGLGSGFIISKEGHIITNNHVIQGAQKIDVYLSEYGKPYEAKLIGYDKQLDLAVIKIEVEKPLSTLNFGDSEKLKVGSWVIAIGNPYGLDHTVTVGVISAKGRPIEIDGNKFKDLLQTDASINPGNSGGPLLNLQGEVIGINTAISKQAQGIGFAIPSSTVQKVLHQLIEKGKVIRPWLGVSVQNVTQDIANYFGLMKTQGVIITDIEKNSPADKAGLRKGDIILSFNEIDIKNYSDLKSAIDNTKIGQKTILNIYRNRQDIYIPVIIGEH